MYYLMITHSDQPRTFFEIQPKDGGEGEAIAKFLAECSNYAKLRASIGGTTEVALFRRQFGSQLPQDIVQRRVKIEMDILNGTKMQQFYKPDQLYQRGDGALTELPTVGTWRGEPDMTGRKQDEERGLL